MLTQQHPFLLDLELLVMSGDILVGMVITEVAEDLIALRHLQKWNLLNARSSTFALYCGFKKVKLLLNVGAGPN